MADEKIVPENGLEVRYERYKGIIKNFTLMSDIFMRNVFKQRECLEYVLQVIMEKQDLKVIDQIIQKAGTIRNHGLCCQRFRRQTV